MKIRKLWKKVSKYKSLLLVAIISITINIVACIDFFQRQIEQHTMTKLDVVLLVALLILVFGVLVHLVQWRMNLREKYNSDLLEKEKEIQKYGQILMATATGTYKGIRRLDLETGNSEYIYFEDGLMRQVETGAWMDWLVAQEKNVHPRDYGKVRSQLDLERLRAMAVGTTDQITYRSWQKNDEGYYPTYSTSLSIISEDGRKTAVFSIIDTTASVMDDMAQRKLMVSAASIYISMHVINLQTDTMEILKSADYIAKIVNNRKSSLQQVLADVMRELTDEQYLESMMDFIDFSTLDDRMEYVNTITFEFLGNRSGWCRGRFIAVDYDVHHKLRRVIWAVENIDAEKRHANKLLYLSETDLMTGIRNRGSGERKIKELLADGHQGMFCLLDADKFKAINDDFGHDVGDKVIIEIANCLKKSFREVDVVMRLGGDEFAVFADGITTPLLAERVIKRFYTALEAVDIPEMGERKIYVSLGAAFHKLGDGMNFEKLYRCADTCTYESKKIIGNSHKIYDGME